jgi:hypothetical protein
LGNSQFPKAQRVRKESIKGGDPIHGSIDRYTGFTVVSTYRNKEIVGIYNLTCKPATPLF